MPADQPALLIELLRAAYAAFNARDIDAALALMTPDVAWPKAFKGGFVRGSEAVRAYWTEQWSELNPHVEPISFYSEETGRILVDVHQVVRDESWSSSCRWTRESSIHSWTQLDSSYGSLPSIIKLH